MLLGYQSLLPAESSLPSWHLPCPNRHIHHPSFLSLLCCFIGVSLSLGTPKGKWLGGRGRQAQSSSGETRAECNQWLLTAAERASACVVNAVKCFESHLWVETLPPGGPACCVFIGKVYAGPQLQFPFSFIELVIIWPLPPILVVQLTAILAAAVTP